MSLTVTYKDNKLSLVGKDGRTHEVSAAQQQQWLQTLNGLAQQHGLKDAQELLSEGTVQVPESGDSQWRMGVEAGIAPKDINAGVVALNDHIPNPDLIHAYHQGDLTPDFIMLPVPPEAGPGPETPAGPKPDTSTPQKFGASLLDAPNQETRNTWINDYVKNPETSFDDVKQLLSLDYGKDSDVNRKQIIRAYVDKVAGNDRNKQTQALKDLAQVDWKLGNGQSIDVEVDKQVLAVARDLCISPNDLPLNPGAKPN
ncbi:hypothetical protein KXR53_03620 [Inquilinus limosus]|uniref:hypothetical protein n=1 Tax=Inquilinus limosus TaxID=171674 RepID=UPI003F1359DC